MEKKYALEKIVIPNRRTGKILREISLFTIKSIKQITDLKFDLSQNRVVILHDKKSVSCVRFKYK